MLPILTFPYNAKILEPPGNVYLKILWKCILLNKNKEKKFLFWFVVSSGGKISCFPEQMKSYISNNLLNLISQFKLRL